MFNHMESPELQQLPTIEIDGDRYYQSPSGKMLPSITTILGYANRKFIEEWRQRVGEKEANNVSRIAAERGTIVHDLAEKYLKNEQIPMLRLRPDHKQLFLGLRPHLNDINNIRYLEAPLYSESLGTAGRTDCIAEYKGDPAIIDFKTSRKDKKEEWIQHYFEQGTGYSLMLEERTGIVIEKIVIIITNDNQYSDTPTQVFSINRSEFIMSLKEKITKYHRERGNHYEQRGYQHLCDARVDGLYVSESNVSTG